MERRVLDRVPVMETEAQHYPALECNTRHPGVQYDAVQCIASSKIMIKVHHHNAVLSERCVPTLLKKDGCVDGGYL